MALDVHLSVVFACDTNDGPARLALKHLAMLPDDAPEECRWFLTSLAERSGYNFGPKGGLSFWGTVGNYTMADAFVRSLSAFWEELLAEHEDDGYRGGPLPHEHVIVFYETQGDQCAHCYEIGWSSNGDDGWAADGPGRTMIYRHHRSLPFAWMQF